MKKWFLSFFLLSVFLLTWCWNNVIEEEPKVNTWNEKTQEINDNLTPEDTIINYIANKYDCNDWSKLFVNYAELWMKSLWDWIAEWYITTIGEWFYIDKRWNLNNSCGFGVPMKIVTSSKDWIHYTVIDSIQARDWNEYDKSIREMFSDEAIDILYHWNLRFMDGRTLLKMAEEYFGVTIIPKPKNNFECAFCDKLRYYNRTPEADEKLNQTSELYFDYTTNNNWNNTIYFGSDWSFEAKGSRDEWTWTWTFGQDENTIIVLNNNSDHVYTRYIIINQTEKSLNTILEIIQRS